MTHRIARRLPSPPREDTELDRIARRLPSPPREDTELDRIARRLPSPPVEDTEVDRIGRRLQLDRIARRLPWDNDEPPPPLLQSVAYPGLAIALPDRPRLPVPGPLELAELAGENLKVHGGKLRGRVGQFCYPKVLVFNSSWSRFYMMEEGDYACASYQKLRSRSSVVSLPYDSYTLVLSHWHIRPEVGYYALHRTSDRTNIKHAIAVVYARSATQDPWKLYVYDTSRGPDSPWSEQEAKRLSAFVYSTARSIKNGPVLSRAHAGIHIQPFLSLNVCDRTLDMNMCFSGFCVLVSYLEALNALLPYKDRAPRLSSGEEAVNALNVVISFILAPQRHVGDQTFVVDLMLERLRAALISKNLAHFYSAIYGSTRRALEAWTTRNILITTPTASTRRPPLRQLAVHRGTTRDGVPTNPPLATDSYRDPRWHPRWLKGGEDPIWGHQDQEDMAAWAAHRDHRTQGLRRKLANRIKPVPWTGFKGVRDMQGAFLPNRHYVPVDEILPGGESDSSSSSSGSDMDISPAPKRRWRRPKQKVYRSSRSYSDISPVSPVAPTNINNGLVQI
jgi:hypothetical protein